MNADKKKIPVFSMTETSRLLKVKNLSTSFFTDDGEVKAVDTLSFSINQGKVLGIVGESGSGKSVTALSIMRLVPGRGKTLSGEIVFKDKEILSLPESKMRSIRGKEIAMIFQDPMTSLNPVFTIGEQVNEAIMLHQNITKTKAKNETIKMLEKVQIPNASERINDYPHQFSGGMRQRVMIAMALSCNPSLLIADEPTTALDVTVQAQILTLMRELQHETGSSIILITHDLGIVAELTDDVLVMYAGQMVEYADVFELFRDPSHPYTVGLLNSLPRLDDKEKERLVPIPGQPPSLLNLPKGCRFQARCPKAMEQCNAYTPPLYEINEGHLVRCFLYSGKKEISG